MTIELAVTFIIGLLLGALVEYKYGAKITATVTADVATLKADVASLKAKAAADVAAVQAKV